MARKLRDRILEVEWHLKEAGLEAFTHELLDFCSRLPGAGIVVSTADPAITTFGDIDLTGGVNHFDVSTLGEVLRRTKGSGQGTSRSLPANIDGPS